VWLGVAPLCLWAVVRQAGLDAGTPLVPLLAFTPIAALAAFILASVCVALRCWAAAVATALAFACLAVAVLPPAFGHGEPVPTEAASIEVLSANLYYGRAEPQALLGLVAEKRPDLLLVQELTPSLAEALRRGGIGSYFRHVEIALPRRGFGRAVYSRLPLRRLGERLGHPSALPPLAVRLSDGRALRLVNFHPHPPKPGRVTHWEEALRRLPSAGAGPIRDGRLGVLRPQDADAGADQEHREEDHAGDRAPLAEGVGDRHCSDREEEGYDHAHCGREPIERGRRASR
jgi:endonuclease/exonuclease/phosphatase (EEP) superfamily protein YafD